MRALAPKQRPAPAALGQYNHLAAEQLCAACAVYNIIPSPTFGINRIVCTAMSLNYQSAILAKGYEWETFRIPEPCQGVEVVVGIDEAGRGPVLGSLIYTVAFWPVSEDEIIGKMGFNDSKQLKEQDRERLLDNIRNHPSIGWVIEEITAESIAEVRSFSNGNFS